MTYTRQTWADFPTTTSPTSAARFNWMEAGIQDCSDRITANTTSITGNTTSISTNNSNISTLQSWQTAQTLHPVANGGSAPTAAAGSNAGTSPPAPVVSAASRDARGSVTFGTGTTPAAGNMVVITFNSTWGTAPFVLITPTNSASAALNDYVTSISATGFTIGVAGAPAASQANTVYSFQWQVVG